MIRHEIWPFFTSTARAQSAGVSGVHKTVTKQVVSIGAGTSQRTERVGRRIGPHGEVSRRDDPGSSCRTPASRVRSDSASQGPQPRCRHRAVKVTCRGNGDRAGRGTEEAFQISIGTCSRSGWWARVVVARLGRFARRTCGARQWSYHHGDIDQWREHVDRDFEPIQSLGMTSDALDDATHFSPVVVRRVTFWSARGMRVGEAKNPGTEGITVDSISPTQWDSGAQFSTPDRGSGFTGRASESSLLDAMEFDLTTADDAVTGAAVGGMSQRIVPQHAFRRRLEPELRGEDRPSSSTGWRRLPERPCRGACG